MAKTEKSKAELYREERKERIAKSNKKNSKTIEKGRTVAGVIQKIVAVIVVLAIVFGIGYWLNATTGFVTKNVSAVKIGDAKVSAVVYRYYYSNMYQQTSYYAEQYSQYGMDMGFNSELSPDDPSNTTTDEDGNTITWAESFKQSAIDRAQYVEAYYAKAVAAGYKLDDDAESEIDETIENYRSQAAEDSYSLNGYLKASFGAGFTERVFRKQLEKEQMASKYAEKIQEDYKEAVTDKYVLSEYKKNSKKYDFADIHYYKFAGETLTAADNESDAALAKRQKKANNALYKDAQGVYDSVTDLDSLETALKKYLASQKTTEEETTDTTETTETETTNTTELAISDYEAISSAVGTKGADWVYGARKAGDKTIIKDEANAYIIIVDKPAYTGHSVDVRHCLVKFDAADEDNVTDSEKKVAKVTAEKLLKDWKSGDATEKTFAKLATDNSEDDGSKDDGGLYAGIRIKDSYEQAFLDWSFDPARKVGDTGIIETSYGYHIMYFSKDNTDDIDQYNTIRENKAQDEYDAYDKKLLADDGDFVPVVSDYWTTLEMNKFCKTIKTNLAYSSDNQ